ncbi:hypothetical protein [Roseicyclus persicicus]|uniref:Thioredoxin family protein n=1 Tax=Roseicyclus persicicus TaxID=2650661 RepID=A0A7X6JZP6_9RHOB|nr:hypothetical protein [Roseibacterium persicicum]NKX45749.1 hypothetical protein [Roseibacterium persicicum]
MLHLQHLRVALGPLLAVAGLVLLSLLPRPAAATDWTLVMVEQHGCSYCARWDAEVAPEYPITPEGRFAPLRRVNLRDLPDDLSFAGRPVYTPTFVLMADGVEVGRIEGYPGEDFFWGLLGRLLSRGDAAWATQGTGG